ncbi:hypothetical protein JHK85_023724 [Glycine max]|nr:hypothetical protein JHK85_023724 [Glycine max]
MGFSVAASLGTYVVLRDTHETRIKCQFLCRKEQNSRIGFKFSKHKAIQSAIFFSKHEFTDLDERKSSDEVKEEIKKCYELINRLGRGVVYLGSSRMGPSHSHYVQAQELAKEANLIHLLLNHIVSGINNSDSGKGAGPGLMDAVTQGSMLAGKPVGGFKIGREAGEWTASNFHPYLPSENYLTFRFFSARKHGLVDAVVRNNSFDKTAVVALPGGIGTLDEVFEILALIQLERIGSKFPVPFLLMNYDSFYSKLLEFLNDCEGWGTVSKGEVASLWKVCNSNSEALAYLEEFYGISSSDKSKNVTKLYSTYESPSS